VKYTLSFLGKTTYISGFAFSLAAMFAIILFVASCIGVYLFSGWLLLAALVSFSSITMNGKRHGILPAQLAEIGGRVMFFFGILYLLFHLFG